MIPASKNPKNNSKKAPIQLQKLISTFLIRFEAQKCCSQTKKNRCSGQWQLKVSQRHRDVSQTCELILNQNKVSRIGALTTLKKNRERIRKLEDSSLLFIQEANKYYVIKKRKSYGNFYVTSLKVFLKSLHITNTPGWSVQVLITS